MAAVGSVVEGHRGIVVLAVVHPFCHVGLALAGELMSVEVADEILCCAAAEGSARVDVADKHPLAVAHLHEVGALPHTLMAAVALAEGALEGPVLEVVGRVDIHLLSARHDDVVLLVVG